MELVSQKDSYWRSFKNPFVNFGMHMHWGNKGRVEHILQLIERDLYAQFMDEADFPENSDDKECRY